MEKKSLMMTLERLLSFIDTEIPRDTRCLARGLIPVRRVACILNAAQNSRAKREMSPQFCWTRGNAPTTLIRVQTENRIPPKIAPLQLGQSRA